MAAVLLVLVIGCANIANLQLARAAAREREVAVRRALGASMARTVHEQLIETLVVSLAGGALGLVLTIWALDALMPLAPAGLPRRAEVELGWRVVAFSLTAAVMTGLAFGLFPAFQAGRASVLQVERRRSHERRR
jgi:putative ABC transport system permease protein